jgi:hypothetical protein
MRAVTRGQRLDYFTIAWNSLEAPIALRSRIPGRQRGAGGLRV